MTAGATVRAGDAHIAACTDLTQLEAWGDRALTADTVDEIFD